ncbi:MAG: carboxypeptidase-like regulatory domain-containing protein [Bacteroidota bacterium]
MKRVLLFALIGIFTLAFQSLEAQSAQGSIKGIVFDVDYQEGLPFANVLLYQEDQFVAGVATDWDGLFHLKNIDTGIYRLEVQYIDYETIHKPDIEIKNNQVIDLGQLSMKPEEIPPCPCPPFYQRVDIPTFSLNPWAPNYTFNAQEIKESPARP